MLDEPRTASEVETLNVLRSEGIIVCAAQELFGATGIQLLDRIGKEVDGLVEKQRDSFGLFPGHIKVSVVRSKFQQRMARSTTLRWTMRFYHHDGNHVWE